MITRTLFSCLCATLLLASCGNKSGDGMATANNAKADSMKTAYKAISDAWDAGKVDEFDKYVAANAVDHDGMPGQKPGIAGMKEMASMMKAGYPNMKSTIEDLRVDGDVLTVRYKVSGTNSGAMMGMPPTNKKMSDVGGYDQMRWENGKFVEHWGVFDAAKMMMQLGMMPHPPDCEPGAGTPPPPPPGAPMGKDEMKKK